MPGVRRPGVTMIVSTLYRRGDYDENELYGEERFYGGVQISVSNKPWLFQTTYNISILIRIDLYSALFLKKSNNHNKCYIILNTSFDILQPVEMT